MNRELNSEIYIYQSCQNDNTYNRCFFIFRRMSSLVNAVRFYKCLTIDKSIDAVVFSHSSEK